MSHATKPVRPQATGRARPARIPALIVAAYAVAVYLVLLAVLGYAVGFFAGAGVPKGIDQGPRATVPVAAAIDLLLLLVFAVQHTVMARPWFKRTAPGLRRGLRLLPVPGAVGRAQVIAGVDITGAR